MLRERHDLSVWFWPMEQSKSLPGFGEVNIILLLFVFPFWSSSTVHGTHLPSVAGGTYMYIKLVAVIKCSFSIAALKTKGGGGVGWKGEEPKDEAR